MELSSDTERSGCGQAVVIVALLLWLGVVLIGAAISAGALIGSDRSGGTTAALIGVVGLLLLLPALGVALLTRGRAGWEATAALAAGLVALAGYVLLDMGARATWPDRANWVALAHAATLVPYVLAAAWFAPRLAGRPHRPLGAWLGLDRFALSTLLLGFGLMGLLTLPWPVTGALGDRLTTLELALQTLAWIVPFTVLLWGPLFTLVTSAFERAWLAALTTIACFGLALIGRMAPTIAPSGVADLVLLLATSILLAELRARGGGIYPLLPVAWGYRLAPRLFVDPRDVVANLSPEPQHIAAYAIVIVTAVLLGLVLWVGRRLLLAVREGDGVPGWVRLSGATLVASAIWAAWVGLYLAEGEPGFFDDGFLIILEEQAHLQQVGQIADREERLQATYQVLVETAEHSQAPLRRQLDELGVPYRPYYIINMIRVDGHRWLMHRFEDEPGVAQVLLNPNVREYPRRVPFPYGGDEGPSPGVQTNLAAIHADEAWEMEVTGDGVVVAGQDTGYDWTHPALQPHYRGWDGQTATHDYNWYDAWDHNAVPFDDDSHGTHTMGTVLGDDGDGNRTGVAPDARWIGCRNMRRGFGNPGAYAACMEFFLAPYPHGGDPFRDGDVRRAPHVVNNSWGCPDFEGCRADTLRPAVEALRAAGIMMVVSAGNEGPACATATTPPANYDAVFSVGATNSDGDIVGFSSRGPVGELIKPDVAAPGAYVRSSVPGGGYGYAGGTSMAGPHVAGVVALLWSADPALIGDIAATEALICQTARPRPVETSCSLVEPDDSFTASFSNPVCACGGVTGVPNNIYGCGFIDAGEAVRQLLGR